MGRVLFRGVGEQLCIATFVQSKLLPQPGYAGLGGGGVATATRAAPLYPPPARYLRCNKMKCAELFIKIQIYSVQQYCTVGWSDFFFDLAEDNT